MYRFFLKKDEVKPPPQHQIYEAFLLYHIRTMSPNFFPATKKSFSLLMKVELKDAKVAKQSQKPFSKSLCVEEDRHGDSSSRLWRENGIS